MQQPTKKNIGLIITVVILALALVGVVTYVLVDKFVVRDMDSQKMDTPKTSVTTDMKDSDDGKKNTTAPQPASRHTGKYVDYRQSGKNETGKVLYTAADADALEVSDEVKQFLKSKIGTEGMGGTKIYPVVDRVDGEYAAVGSMTNAYVIIGPKNGTGKIDIVAGTQQLGMHCSDLKAAKVPSSLVDGKCVDSSMQNLVPYTQ